MTREQIKELVVGPIATVPTPFDDDFEVDYGRMYELTQGWVGKGLVKGKAVIKVAAAMGEGPMLRDDEWPYLLRTVVRAADDKAAIVCGLHYKDTKRTIEDAVCDLVRAFQDGRLPNSLTDIRYSNIKTMQALRLT